MTVPQGGCELGLVLLFSLLAVALPATADNRDTGYATFYQSSVWCVQGRALLRHPSSNPNYILDYNSFIRGWTASCSSARTFLANTAAVKGQLWHSSGICRSFNWVTNSSETSLFGAGAVSNAYCGPGSYWTVGFQRFRNCTSCVWIPSDSGNSLQTSGHSF